MNNKRSRVAITMTGTIVGLRLWVKF